MFPFHIRLGHLKLLYYGIISIFSKYYFKTSTVCILFLASHVFTALDFFSNHLDILLWKILKALDHNEVRLPTRKIFRKYKPIRHDFEMPRKKYLCLFVNKIYGNYNNVTYFQKNSKCYNLKTTFQNKVTFLSKFSNSCRCGFKQDNNQFYHYMELSHICSLHHK